MEAPLGVLAAPLPNISEVSRTELASAFERYTQYVRCVVPAEQLLEINYFESFPQAVEPAAPECAGATECMNPKKLRGRWTAVVDAAVGQFARGWSASRALETISANTTAHALAYARCSSTCYVDRRGEQASAARHTFHR